MVISLLLVLLMAFYGFLLKKHPVYFGSFTKSFIKFGVATYFWIIVLCLRFLDSLLLVLLKGSDLVMAVELSLATILFVFILVIRPYVCSSYRRQGINFACTFSVLSLEMIGRLVKGNQSIEIFMPLAICAIFTVALLSNSFYFLQ